MSDPNDPGASRSGRGYPTEQGGQGVQQQGSRLRARHCPRDERVDPCRRHVNAQREQVIGLHLSLLAQFFIGYPDSFVGAASNSCLERIEITQMAKRIRSTWS
ncbi:MAG: hypothetical protein OES09_17470 [Gammaproteobacteria bacterium]|nr:hypothetical protein [Gammaproteobacteria bacterium]